MNRVLKTLVWVTLFSFSNFLGGMIPVYSAEDELVELVNKVKPSVVTVLVFSDKDEIISQGSGFFISPNRIVTNRHVIEIAHHAQIKSASGNLFNIQGLLAEDKNLDLVILSVDIPKNTIKPLELSKLPPKEGQEILVVGSPFGLEKTVSNGIVSAIRELPGWGEIIQITAPVSPGSSGSAVVNKTGSVIGIVVSQFIVGQNLNFSIPATQIKSLKIGKVQSLSAWSKSQKFASVQSTFGQKTKDPVHVDLSKTLGFIMGQRFQLNRIKIKYPSLGLRVQKADFEFKTAFSIADENIEKSLQNMLKDKYSAYVVMMEKQLKSTLSSQQLNQDIAAQFLDEVESRARGNIPSPILETLLTYQFKDRPEEEFARGYNRVFKTKGHPKAKGVDFQIRYPISWRPEEGERPNIIQKFTSENGRGLEMLLIMVEDTPLPPGYTLTQKDLDDFFIESELKGIVPEGGKFISAKPIVLDNHKGAMMLFDLSKQRVDMTFTMKNLYFITICDQKMIFIDCTVSRLQGKELELQEQFNRFEPLFKMIANSFIIQEQYK